LLLGDHFNHVAGWVASSIVSEPDLKERASLYSRFVNIAKILRKLNNFR